MQWNRFKVNVGEEYVLYVEGKSGGMDFIDDWEEIKKNLEKAKIDVMIKLLSNKGWKIEKIDTRELDYIGYNVRLEK